MNISSTPTRFASASIPGAWPGTPETGLAKALADLAIADTAERGPRSSTERTRTSKSESHFVSHRAPNQPSRPWSKRIGRVPTAPVACRPLDSKATERRSKGALTSRRGVASQGSHGRIGLKPKANVLLLSHSSSLKSRSYSSSRPFGTNELAAVHPVEPSGKGRAHKRLSSRRIEAIKLEAAAFDHRPLPDTPALPNTPASISTTPVEMYSPDAAKYEPRSALSPASANQRLTHFSPSTPVRPDPAPLMVITTLPEESPLREIQIQQTSASAAALRLRSGSVHSVIAPGQNTWQRSMYLPGPIRIDKLVTRPLDYSLNGLNMFKGTIEPLESLASRKASEDAAMDEIAEFFETFGFAPIAYEPDDFWERDNELILSARRSTISRSLPASPSPPIPLHKRTSAQSNSKRSVQQPQKMGLRRFLASATSIL